MATRIKRVPAKLKHDAIMEALFEVRFDTGTLPEVLFGRLIDQACWKGFQQVKLPAYQLPEALRQVDASLRYAPLFELRSEGQNRSVRIGGRVLSYHRLAPYESWEKFKPELDEAIDGLFAKADGLTIRRLGLRYLNAIRPDLHGIGSISELDLALAIADKNLSGNVNLNFTVELSNNTNCTVRLATKEFIQGPLPDNTVVLVDVDVYTRDSFKTNDPLEVKQWLDFAHVQEKEQFFGLLTDSTIDALEVK